MPDNNRLRDRIQNANMYNLRKWVNIFFQKLELENNPAPIDFSHLSIEHLMPQTVTKEWLDELKTDKDTYEEYIHRLGNLTLAARYDNSRMGNKVWEYKNRVLSSTNHLKINIELLQKEHWTLEDIEQRTQRLIVDISRLYPYYEAKSITQRILIHISHPNLKAFGYYYPDNGSVELLESSELNMEMPNIGLYPDIEQQRDDLLEGGFIAEVEGKLKVVSNFTIFPKRTNTTALSSAAALILHGSRNGWEYWLTEDGTMIGDIDGLRNKRE